MEQSKLSMLWKTHYRQILILFIRLTEVVMSGVLLSFLGVVLIFIRPDKSIWNLMTLISMAGFLVVNCRFILKYMVSREQKVIEFYIINGITFLIYGVASVIAYHYCGYLVYSIVYAHFRVFEVFHAKTLNSIYLSNVLIIVTMLMFRIFARRHMEFTKKLMFVDDSVDTSELEKYYTDSEAVQNNQTINIMSLEEMNENIINEIREAHEAQQEKLDKIPDELWRRFERGDGSEIEFKTPDDPDDDYDENDRVAANNINPNEAYSTDNLWDDNIYGGKEKIEDYDDVDPLPAPIIKDNKTEIKNEILWHLKSFGKLINIRRNYRHNELMMRDMNAVTHSRKNMHSNYDSENLWDSNIYQGTDESNIPKKVMDFEDASGPSGDSRLENYDSDRLWDINERKKTDGDNEENKDIHVNPNEDYDADSLWQTGFKQGADEITSEELRKDMSAGMINPNEDYDTDSLWSKDIKQGR